MIPQLNSHTRAAISGPGGDARSNSAADLAEALKPITCTHGYLPTPDCATAKRTELRRSWKRREIPSGI